MKLNTLAVIAGILLTLGMINSAFAGSWHGYHGGPKWHGGNCGGGGGSECKNPEKYSETFYTKDFNTKDKWKGKKVYWGFDAIDAPGLEISSATLTVKTSSNAWLDHVWGENKQSWFGVSYIGKLTGGEDVFSLSSKFFDEIVDGITFKAFFSKDSENIFWASLNVNGKYCPPVSEVPLPAAVWLFGSALVGFTGFRRRLKKA